MYILYTFDMKLGDDVVGQLDGNKYDQGTLYTCKIFKKRK